MWPLTIHNGLEFIKTYETIGKTYKKFFKFGFCSKCFHTGYPNGCILKYNCGNKINLLRNLQPHYPGIRTLIRKIYYIKETFDSIFAIRRQFKSNDSNQLKSLLDNLEKELVIFNSKASPTSNSLTKIS
jgi:hypothetical protein